MSAGVIAASYVEAAGGGGSTATATITVPTGKVASDLTNFVARVNLAHLPAGWWSSIDAGGGNIRVRKAGVDIPFDLVWIDTATKAGELFFKTSLLAASANTVTIEAVAGATAPAVTDPIGRNAVWSDYDAVVLGGKVNRTGGTAPVSVGTQNVTADGWLSMDWNGLTYVSGLPQRSAWTMAVSTVPIPNGSGNRAALSYNANATSGNFNRETIVDQSLVNRGVWNDSDSWRYYGTVASGVEERRAVTHNGTTETRVYLNGALVVTDAGVAQKPSGGAVSEMVLGDGTSAGSSEKWQGRLNYAYVRNGILSADWIAAEDKSWRTPASFYTVT